MTRHRPGDRVRLRRGHVAHLIAPINTPDNDARFTLCGIPVLLDDRAALAEDPDCVGCYDRPAKTRRPISPRSPR